MEYLTELKGATIEDVETHGNYLTLLVQTPDGAQDELVIEGVSSCGMSVLTVRYADRYIHVGRESELYEE